LAFLDPFRRALGVSTPEEIDAARREREATEASAEPRDLFAAAAAVRVAGMDQARAAQDLHALADGEWPADRDVRWTVAASAARRMADDALARPVPNMDPELGRATTRRALVEASMMLADPGTREGPARTLETSTAAVRDDVLAFMSYGTAAERNAAGHARAASSDPEAARRLGRDVAEFLPASGDRGWTLKAARVRLAMAQGGLMDPDRTVEAAVEAAQSGAAEQGALMPCDRQAARRADPQVRRRMVEETQDRTLVAAYGREEAALEAARRESALPARAEPVAMDDAQRQAHAAMLIKEQLRRTRAVDSPRAVLTGGQPGSGKSYVVRSVSVEFEGMGGAVRIDPDEIRPTLPYMAERIAAGDLEIPNAANVDAGTIAYQMVQIAKRERRNLVVDGTLQNTARALDLAGEMRAASYRVDFQGVAAYPDLSHARTYGRREEQIAESPTGFGRGVGDEFHDQAVKGYGLTVEAFQKKAAVDSMTLHFGDGGAPISTRYENGRWVPAVDIKATLDRAFERPTPASLSQAAETWKAAATAMTARGADPAETAKVEGFRDAAERRREAAATPAAPSDAARLAHLRAAQSQGRGG
jgi:hypothetical protein